MAVIREGMSCIVPVPLLSMYTAEMLEHAVCGKEHVDLTMLKKVVRYVHVLVTLIYEILWTCKFLDIHSNCIVC